METVIKSRIPGIQSLINKTIAELESELSRLGKPIAADAGVSVLCLPNLAYIYISVASFLRSSIPKACHFSILIMPYNLQGKLYTIMEICRLFDQIYKEHLDGVYVLCVNIFP